MSHKNIIYDSDPHFKINAITRQISNESSKKTTLIQNDHNSERFTFEVDRFIEGHDMMECNRVEVHYNNNGNEDVYEVDDVQINPNNDDTVVFSWLLSNNATQNEGKLEFSIRFACTSEDGIVDYAWNTAIFNGISISKGMNNSEAVSGEISDIIAKWKEDLKDKIPLHEGDENNTLVHGHTLSNWKASGVNNKVVEYIENNVLNENGKGIQLDDEGKVVAGAFGDNSVSLGTKSQALGGKSLAEGSKTIAFGNNTHAEGNGTFAVGQHSHTEGSGTTAIGNSSHAEGRDTIAEGSNTHAEGYGTSAIGDNSHTEGLRTTADGHDSHAEGYETNAQHDDSHTEGIRTVTGGGCQHVQGKWNEVMGGDYAHVVGNGSDDDNRSNAHTLDWKGNAWFAGTVEATGIILKSPNGTRYMLTVNDTGELSTNAM